MSWLAAISAPDTQANDEAMRSTPGPTIDTLAPDSWEGLGGAIGNSAMRGLARVGDAVGIAGSVPFVLKDWAQGEHDETGARPHAADDYFSDVTATTRNAVDYWVPDARTTGHASQVVGQLVEGLIPLAAGPEMLMAAGLSHGAEVKGSPTAAVGSATLDALAAGLGLKVPMAFGKSILTKIATGIAANEAFGTTAIGLKTGLFSATGDEKLVEEQVAALKNPETHLIQAIMGAAFGVYGHMVEERLPPPLEDAVLTANNSNHFTERSAPGIPADPESSALHQAALEESLAQINRGESVNVTVPVGEAEFRPVEQQPTDVARGADEQVSALRESGEVLPEPPPTDDVPQRTSEQVLEKPESTPPKPATATKQEQEPLAENAPKPGTTDAISPSVREAIAAAPDAMVAHGLDDEGLPIYRKASEVMAEIHEEMKTATNDAKKYEAAVTCFIGNGP